MESRTRFNKTTKIINPESASSLREKVKQEEALIYVPIGCPEDAKRNLRICLNANLSVFLVKIADVDRNIFRRTENGEFEFTEKAVKDFGGLSSVRGVPEETMRIIAETLCGNANRPLWSEGYQLSKMFYLMVIHALSLSTFKSLTESKETELPIAKTKKQGKYLAAVNGLAKVEDDAIQCLARSAAIEESLKANLGKIATHAEIAYKTMNLISSFPEGKTVDVEQTIADTREYIKNVLEGNGNKTAREYAKDAFVRTGWKAEVFESKVTQTPFRAVESSDRANELVSASIDQIRTLPTMNGVGAINFATFQRPKDSRLEDTRKKSLETGEEKILCQTIANCKKKGIQMTVENVSLAMRLGWDFDQNSLCFRSKAHTKYTIPSSILENVKRTDLWNLVTQSVAKPKKLPPNMMVEEKEIKEKEKQIFLERIVDSHRLSHDEVITRFNSYIMLQYKEEIINYITNEVSTSLPARWLAARTMTKLAVPPIEGILRSLSNDVTAISFNSLKTSATYQEAIRSERDSLTEVEAKKCLSNMVTSILTESMKASVGSRLFNIITKVVVSYIFVMTYLRRQSRKQGMYEKNAANQVLILFKRMTEHKETTLTISDYRKLEKLGLSMTLDEKDREFSQDVLQAAGPLVNAVSLAVEKKWSEISALLTQHSADSGTRNLLSICCFIAGATSIFDENLFIRDSKVIRIDHFKVLVILKDVFDAERSALVRDFDKNTLSPSVSFPLNHSPNCIVEAVLCMLELQTPGMYPTNELDMLLQRIASKYDIRYAQHSWAADILLGLEQGGIPEDAVWKFTNALKKESTVPPRMIDAMLHMSMTNYSKGLLSQRNADSDEGKVPKGFTADQNIGRITVPKLGFDKLTLEKFLQYSN